MQTPRTPSPFELVTGPTLVVHDADHLRLAVDATASAGWRRLRLLSAPSAACFGGPAWWRALMTLADSLARESGIALLDMLDCGDSAGRALEALRLGQKALVLAASPQWTAVQERATPLGARLLDRRPDAFDLAARNAAHDLPAYLRPDDTGPSPG